MQDTPWKVTEIASRPCLQVNTGY